MSARCDACPRLAGFEIGRGLARASNYEGRFISAPDVHSAARICRMPPLDERRACVVSMIDAITRPTILLRARISNASQPAVNLRRRSPGKLGNLGMVAKICSAI